MDELKKSINENFEVRQKIKIEAEDIDYKIAESYIPFFKLMDSAKTSIVVVYDMFKDNAYYVSERFYDFFGFSKDKSKQMDHLRYRNRFHPDDYIINQAGTEFHRFLYAQPIKKRKDFKLIHDFRLKNENGKYIRLIVQDYLLELDAKGNPWLNMKLCDLAPVQDLDAPARTVCRNITTGEMIFTYEGNKEISIQISEREKQVLSLVANGMKSEEIAEKLCISANTVNNHRRNMIKKLNVSNSSEAIKLAIKLGVI